MDRRTFTTSLAGGFARLGACGAQLPSSRFDLVGDLDIFDVRRFGARGNGADDDSASFVRALAAAAVRGGIVEVPDGRYMVKRMLRVASNVRLKGFGAATLLSTPSDSPIALLAVRASSCAVEGLAITGRFAHGILFDHVENSSISRCSIEGGTVSRFGYSGGVFVVGSRGIVVSGCTFERNGGPGRFQGSDIQCDGLGQRSDSIRIIRNRCRSTDVAVNIRCYDTSRSEISGNIANGARVRTTNNHGYGILIYETPANRDSCFENTVRGNTVSDTQGSGIYLVRSHRTRVSENDVRRIAKLQNDDSLPVAGIAINSSREVTITRNRIVDSGRAGISLVQGAIDSGPSEISDNEITRASGYGIHLRGPTSGVRVLRNTVAASGGGIGGDTTDSQSDLEISGNMLIGTKGRAGIRLWRVRGSVICGNTIRDPSGFALDLVITDDASEVSGNVLERAGTRVAATPGDVRVVRLPRPKP